MAGNKDAQNPYVATGSNDKAHELVQIVMEWYRSHRGSVNATQVTNITTSITAILNETVRV